MPSNRPLEPGLRKFLEVQLRTLGCQGCGENLDDLLPAPSEFHTPELSGWNSLRASERTTLERFFRTLICEGHFGYVLFGSKPMAQAPVVPDNLRGKLDHPESRAFRSDYDTFAGLLERLPPPRLQMHLFKPNAAGCKDLIIFDAARMGRVVTESLELFQGAFGPAFDHATISTRLKASSTLRAALTDNLGVFREDLLGMLFGIPRTSALAFDKAQKSGVATPTISTADWASNDFAIAHVKFRADPGDAEAREVFAGYESERRYIDRLMRGDEWLKVVIERLFPVI